LLLEKGAEVNAEGGYFGTALDAASIKHKSIKDKSAVVALLLEYGPKRTYEL
jgi:hypothetical protein